MCGRTTRAKPDHRRLGAGARPGLAAGTRSIEILVHERDCASGDTAEGRIETDINYRTEAIVVTVHVRPKSGDRDCQGNPATPYTLKLDEPLHDRELLMGTGDGTVEPSADM